VITRAELIHRAAQSGGNLELHYTGASAKFPNGHRCQRTTGPRGGVQVSIIYVRQSGQVKTWKRDPKRFRMPVKYGLYESSEVTQDNASDFHWPEDCGALHG
jgi:hypothetical protein